MSVAVFSFAGSAPGSGGILRKRDPCDQVRKQYILLFIASCLMLFFMPERWCTVTTTDAEGRRHSVDVQAASTFDAAHIYLTHAKAQPGAGIPPLRVNVFVFPGTFTGR
jgi:hypothetical protein